MTVEHVARVAIRNPEMVAAAAHYLLTELLAINMQVEGPFAIHRLG